MIRSTPAFPNNTSTGERFSNLHLVDLPVFPHGDSIAGIVCYNAFMETGSKLPIEIPRISLQPDSPPWRDEKRFDYVERSDFPDPPTDRINWRLKGKDGLVKKRCWEIKQTLIQTGLWQILDDARAEGMGNLFWYRVPPEWLSAGPNAFLIDHDSDLVKYDLTRKNPSDSDIDLTKKSPEAIGFGFAIYAKSDNHGTPWRYFLLGQQIMDPNSPLCIYSGEIHGPKKHTPQRIELISSSVTTNDTICRLVLEKLEQFKLGEIPLK